MPSKVHSLSVEDLLELLTLVPDTGRLFWRERSVRWFANENGRAEQTAKMWNTKFAGKEALTSVVKRGYKRGTILNMTAEAHQVVFAIHTGVWASGQIDHENGNTADNRPCNLRDATRKMQARNAAMPTTNKSGVVGVCWSNHHNKWCAFIHVRNRKQHLGVFREFDAAVAVRKQAERQYGFHPNHGRKAA